MVPLVVTTFDKLGPSAQGFLQSLAELPHQGENRHHLQTDTHTKRNVPAA